MKRLMTVALVLVLAGAGRATAQGTSPSPKPGDKPKLAEEPPAPENVERAVRIGYEWRRQGNYDAAASVFREALRHLKGPARARLVADLGEMFTVQGKHEKAGRFYREEKEPAREAEAFGRAGLEKEALAAAKRSGDALVQARVLELLAKNDEALEAYGKAGAAREKGDLLLKLSRAKDAAQAYADAKEDYLRGLALRIAGDGAAAQAAFAAAKAKEQERVEQLVSDAKALQKKLNDTGDPVERERVRYDLAAAIGAMVTGYDRLALCFESANDTRGAARLAELAAKHARTEKETLTDAGRDKLGETIAKQRDLDARIERIEKRARELGRALPAPGEGPR